MTRLLYVTGVSGAGKTHLGDKLRRFPSEATVWDLDVDATERPRTAHLEWLRWRAAEYLVQATERSEPDDEHLLVVTGIVWPFQVIESSAWRGAAKNPDLSVEWLMLDPAWKTIRRRLEARNVSKPEAEQAELLRYNRALRLVLRNQVNAVRGGYRWRRSHQDNLDRILISDEGWNE